MSGCYQETVPVRENTVHTLTMLLNDPEASVRQTAADALGKIGDQSAESFLVRSLQDADPAVREAAARGLSRLSTLRPETAAELVRLLQDSHPAVQRTAAQALGAAEGNSGLVSSLKALLSSADATVRQSALHALFLLDAGQASTVDALSRRTTDIDPVVRRWAVAALAESGDPRAVSWVMDRLRHDPVEEVRAEAAYRLRFLGDGSIADELGTIGQRGGNAEISRWTVSSQRALKKGPDFDSAPLPDPLTAPGPSHQSP
jgi:HEAT repeat protein